MKNIEDAMKLHIEDMKISREKITDVHAISISNVEVSV